VLSKPKTESMLISSGAILAVKESYYVLHDLNRWMISAAMFTVVMQNMRSFPDHAA